METNKILPGLKSHFTSCIIAILVIVIVFKNVKEIVITLHTPIVKRIPYGKKEIQFN
jgi:hypothetical protein